MNIHWGMHTISLTLLYVTLLGIFTSNGYCKTPFCVQKVWVRTIKDVSTQTINEKETLINTPVKKYNNLFNMIYVKSF